MGLLTSARSFPRMRVFPRRNCAVQMSASTCLQNFSNASSSCAKGHGLAVDEMGSAMLPSPEAACGPAYDPAALEDVDARGRAHQYYGAGNCADLAAQMVCASQALAKDPSRQEACFCAIVQACTAQSVVHLAERPGRNNLSSSTNEK